MPSRPRRIDQIDTPAVLIDLDRAEQNIARAQAAADIAGLALRPHIKTHKLPFFARRQIAAGAVGITCQKVGEAEVFADAGVNDIFLPYNILGACKLGRLRTLHNRITLSVTADSTTTVEGLAATFSDAGNPLTVLIECDTGAGRCGVQSADEALVLAQMIDATPGLYFGGLMTYPAAGGHDAAEARLAELRDRLSATGLPPCIITTGGTPDIWRQPDTSIVTEYRPGTYIYMDRSQIAHGVATTDDCALTVLTTVVSHPTPTRAVLDAGSKALSSDLMGLSDHGEIVGAPGARVTSLSEEHAVTLLPETLPLRVGDRVRVLPDHACVVTNLFDVVHLISGDSVIDVLPVAARGRMT